jgi:phenylalanyl-tRNA synthetase beta chain
MKFTLSWLKDHLETDASLTEITDALTAIGLELEEVVDRAAELADFTVAHVVEAKQHPNADRLRLCIVDTGSEQVQVVCGAPNARTGMKGVFAPVGVTIPGTGLELKAGKIRGEESNGMLCSEREMGLSDEHEGIIELPDDAEVGTPFATAAGLDDAMIDINVTPNRQDCLGVYGVARDLAAAGIGRLKTFAPEKIAGGFESPINVTLQFEPGTEDACSCFVGRYFRGLKNGPSPAWLQQRLIAIGLRPISALVDVTNYITYDLGRPLHVFDADKVKGNIHARLARDGEKLLALDGKEYVLDPEVTVIADDNGPEGLGGVMGGEESGCTEETVNMFLEAALFDPKRTAATGRRLGIESDARYRFERGVDSGMLIPGIEDATRMILELCGGEASELVIAGSPDEETKVVPFRPARVADLAGMEVDGSEQRQILEALGFGIEDGGERWQVAVPTWRSDIDGEADIVEEISRVAGFDRIPSMPLPRLPVVASPSLSPSQQRRPLAKRALAVRGMMECVTWSFMPRRFADLFGFDNDDLVLSNPISSELDAMRPSILPNLIQAAGRNAARGMDNAALFEVGPQYTDVTPDGQEMVACGIRAVTTGERHWSDGGRRVDAYDAKADALAVLSVLAAPVDSLQIATEAPPWYHPGRSGVLRLGPKNVLAAFGEIHPGVLRKMDVDGPIAGFEVFVDRVPMSKGKKATTRSKLDVTDFPTVNRDFAFIIDAETPADTVVRAARGADKKLITDVSVFDIYVGAGIEDGKKSVAIAVKLEPRDRTMTDEEIDAVSEKVIDAVGKAASAVLRG